MRMIYSECLGRRLTGSQMEGFTVMKGTVKADQILFSTRLQAFKTSQNFILLKCSSLSVKEMGVCLTVLPKKHC